MITSAMRWGFPVLRRPEIAGPPGLLLGGLLGLLVALTLAVVSSAPQSGASTTNAAASICDYDALTGSRADTHRDSGTAATPEQATVNRVGCCGERLRSRAGDTVLVDGARVATNSADELVDLASPARRTHVLDGDATGGGHRWPGAPDKTPFPQRWSDDEIMHAVSDVATDPSPTPRNVTGPAGSLKTNAGNPARQEVFGMRNGVCIRVVTEPLGEGIIAAHPIIGPC